MAAGAEHVADSRGRDRKISSERPRFENHVVVGQESTERAEDAVIDDVRHWNVDVIFSDALADDFGRNAEGRADDKVWRICEDFHLAEVVQRPKLWRHALLHADGKLKYYKSTYIIGCSKDKSFLNLHPISRGFLIDNM